MNKLDRYTDQEIKDMALTVWAEARGESERGKEAVAHTILNRLNSPRWASDSLTKVVKQPWQFSIWNPETVGVAPDGNYRALKRLDLSDDTYVNCLNICKGVLGGALPDPTYGATHYHTRAITDQVSWRDSLLRAGYNPIIIGSHVFYEPPGNM